MSIYLQGLVIILGVIFELTGIIALSNNYFSKKEYDEDGFWFGPNDNKTINSYKSKSLGKYGTILIVLGATIQLSTILYNDSILIYEANKLSIIVTFLIFLFFAIILNILFYKSISYIVRKRIKSYIRLKLERLNNEEKKLSRLSINDSIRYMNYLVDYEYLFSSIEELRKDLSELYSISDLSNIEFFKSRE